MKSVKNFFDKFSKRCEETKMSNYRPRLNEELIHSYNMDLVTEGEVTSIDKVFVPGHFEVDFNKIKSEYDQASFRRVLRQILDLDLENLRDGMVVYADGYDLGTMFELGYFLGRYVCDNKYLAYNEIRKRLIIEKGTEELYRCIDEIISHGPYIISSYSTSNNRVVCSIDDDKFSNELRLGYSSVAINIDNWKNSPFSSILSGFMYMMGIPFVTYSSEGSDSNVMMLASSLCHIKIDKDKPEQDQINLAVSSIKDIFWDNEYFNKFNNIK